MLVILYFAAMTLTAAKCRRQSCSTRCAIFGSILMRRTDNKLADAVVSVAWTTEEEEEVPLLSKEEVEAS